MYYIYMHDGGNEYPWAKLWIIWGWSEHVSPKKGTWIKKGNVKRGRNDGLWDGFIIYMEKPWFIQIVWKYMFFFIWINVGNPPTSDNLIPKKWYQANSTTQFDVQGPDMSSLLYIYNSPISHGISCLCWYTDLLVTYHISYQILFP